MKILLFSVNSLFLPCVGIVKTNQFFGFCKASIMCANPENQLSYWLFRFAIIDSALFRQPISHILLKKISFIFPSLSEEIIAKHA